jgi:hypothetical protein
MSIGNLMHSGFYSYCKYDDLKEWYITSSKDELIEFKESDGQLRHLNSLTIESETTPLYIQIMPSERVLYIPANSSSGIDYLRVSQIKVLGEVNQKLRFFGCFY